MPLRSLTDYIKVKSPQEAVELLAKHKDRSKIIAGGTMIHELGERGLLSDINVLIDIEEAGLSFVEADGNEVRIGATTTLTDLLRNDVFLSPQLAALHDALKSVKPVQVRNVATIGGEICSSVPVLDVPPALCVLDAKLSVLGPDGSRITSIRDFFKGMFEPDLKEDEILTEVILKKEEGRVASSYVKIGRTAFDHPVVGVAVKLNLDAENVCRDISIYIANLDDVPYRAKEAEEVIRGEKLDDEVIRKAMEVTPKIEPIPTVHASPWYKRKVTKVLLRDAIKQALSRLEVI